MNIINKNKRITLSKSLLSLLAIVMLALPLWPLLHAKAAATAQLYLGPTSQSVTKGSNVVLTLNMASGGNSVYAWQTTLSYPTAYFSSATVATSGGSPFSTPTVDDTISNGTVNIARFSTTSHAYDGALVTITLQSNGTAGVAAVSLAHICANNNESTGCSAVVDGAGTETLNSIAGANITLTTPAGGVASNTGGTTNTGTATKKKSSASKTLAAAAATATTPKETTPATTARTSDTGVENTIALTVTVLDQNHKPVKNAKVTVDGITGYTNTDGKVTLQGVSPSATKASIRYKDQNKTLPLQLQPASEQAEQAAEVTITAQNSSALVPVSLGVALVLLIAAAVFFLIGPGRNVLAHRSKKQPKPVLDQDAHFSAPAPSHPAPVQLPPTPQPPKPEPVEYHPPVALPQPLQPRPTAPQPSYLAPVPQRPLPPKPAPPAPAHSSKPPKTEEERRIANARERAMEPGTIVHPSLDSQFLT